MSLNLISTFSLAGEGGPGFLTPDAITLLGLLTLAVLLIRYLSVCIFWSHFSLFSPLPCFSSGRIPIFIGRTHVHMGQGWAGGTFWLPGKGREMKITYPFYGKGKGIKKLHSRFSERELEFSNGKGNLRLVFRGIPGKRERESCKKKSFMVG